MLPTSGDAIDVWLATGSYTSWHCEPAAHARRDPSPHGTPLRICSNDLLSSTGAYPVGAANVKEIFVHFVYTRVP